MTDRHIHADLIIAWANGAQIQVRTPLNYYGENRFSYKWVDEARPSWINTEIYRVKPDLTEVRKAWAEKRSIQFRYDSWESGPTEWTNYDPANARPVPGWDNYGIYWRVKPEVVLQYVCVERGRRATSLQLLHNGEIDPDANLLLMYEEGVLKDAKVLTK